jgi:hypothetical protein
VADDNAYTKMKQYAAGQVLYRPRARLHWGVRGRIQVIGGFGCSTTSFIPGRRSIGPFNIKLFLPTGRICFTVIFSLFSFLY